jgi:hypothetical protein
MNGKHEMVIFLFVEYTVVGLASFEVQVGQGFAKKVIPILCTLPKTIDGLMKFQHEEFLVLCGVAGRLFEINGLVLRKDSIQKCALEIDGVNRPGPVVACCNDEEKSKWR